MAAIVTDQFRILNANNFVETIDNSTNSYYVVVGLVNPTTPVVGFGRSENWNTDTPNPLDNFNYTKEQSEEGYKNFTVIQCKIKSIEWLYLAAKGHRRAKFNLENKKDTWLVP